MDEDSEMQEEERIMLTADTSMSAERRLVFVYNTIQLSLSKFKRMHTLCYCTYLHMSTSGLYLVMLPIVERKHL